MKQLATSSEYYRSFTTFFHCVQILDPRTVRQTLSQFFDAFSLAKLNESMLGATADKPQPLPLLT